MSAEVASNRPECLAEKHVPNEQEPAHLVQHPFSALDLLKSGRSQSSSLESQKYLSVGAEHPSQDSKADESSKTENPLVVLDDSMAALKRAGKLTPEIKSQFERAITIADQLDPDRMKEQRKHIEKYIAEHYDQLKAGRQPEVPAMYNLLCRLENARIDARLSYAEALDRVGDNDAATRYRREADILILAEKDEAVRKMAENWGLIKMK